VPNVDVVRSVCKNGDLKKRYIYTVHGADQKKLYSHNSGYTDPLYGKQNCNGKYYMSAQLYLILRRNGRVTPI